VIRQPLDDLGHALAGNWRFDGWIAISAELVSDSSGSPQGPMAPSVPNCGSGAGSHLISIEKAEVSEC